MPFDLTIPKLLEAGAHFGHHKSKWNPQMRPFIYTERGGVHIVNLAATLEFAEEAYAKIVEVTAEGQKVLFVGTKPQAREPIREEALRAGQFFMVHRWLGGTLTNFRTIRKSVEKIHQIEQMETEGVFQHLTKKEILRLQREKAKLLTNLEGIIEMKRLPGLVFVVDIRHDIIAVKEATRLGIPVVALCDTNADPTLVDHPIPANDDAVRSIRLFAHMVAEACIEGEAKRQEQLRAEEEEETVSESLADKFIDADEEEELLSMRRVIKRVKKETPAEGEQAEGEGSEAQAEADAAPATADASESGN